MASYPRELDSRYRFEGLLSSGGDRFTALGFDRLSGRRVVVKHDRLESVCRELGVLLAMPPGVTARPLDFFVGQDGKAFLVLERMKGCTLLQIARRAGAADVPRLARDVCRSLTHLHRLGLVHADIKPSNLFVLSSRGREQVRLLDLGSAFGRLAWRDLDDVSEIAGTPPFLAPEIERGWNVDGRADQYSLGVTLRTLFPWLESDPEWRAILRRACQAAPSQRYSDVMAMHDDLCHRFGLEGRIRIPPRFPAGPMRGRNPSLTEVLDRIEGGTRRLLVQARPSTGLTRFMLELVMATARRGGPTVRLLDLSSSAGRLHHGRAAAFVDERARAGDVILWGIGDSSPGLRWLEPSRRAWAADMITRTDWARVSLPPLGATPLAEIVAETLGADAMQAEEFGRALHLEAEGDLARAALGFAVAARKGERGAGLTWRLPEDELETLLSRRTLAPPPDLAQLPEELSTPLRVAARAGDGVPLETLSDLLRAFAPAGALEALTEWGLLECDRVGRVRVATRHLQRQAAESPFSRARDVERWLYEHLRPRPDDIGQVIECSRRAAAHEDHALERLYLATGLEHARERQRWNDLLEILAYPDPAPRRWTLDHVRRQSIVLSEALGPAWSPHRLALLAGDALKSRDLLLAAALWGEIAESPEPKLAVEALILLVEHDLRTCQTADYLRHMERLEQWEAQGQGPEPGVVELKRAWSAQNDGRLEEARAVALEATRRLAGSGSVHEGLGLQQLAALRFASDPSDAIRLMRSALDVARSGPQAAQVHYNLAMMHSRLGQLEACARTADAGLALLGGREQPRLEVALRERRAWTWAAVDRMREARAEGLALLDHGLVRQEISRGVVARILLGYCALHQGSSSVALSCLTRAWEDSRTGCPLYLRASALRWLVDALLDLEAWELVAHFGEDLSLEANSGDAGVELAAARARALRAQVAGDLSTAIRTLTDSEPAAHDAAEPEGASRHLHHLGVLHLAEARATDSRTAAERATRYFDEALRFLPEGGYRYFRARSLIESAAALTLLGEIRRSQNLLDEAASLARTIGSRGLLAHALQTRARQALAAVPTGSERGI